MINLNDMTAAGKNRVGRGKTTCNRRNGATVYLLLQTAAVVRRVCAGAPCQRINAGVSAAALTMESCLPASTSRMF